MTIDGPPYLVGGEGQLVQFRQHEVYELKVLEGSGTADDPFRHVAYWVLPDGRLLARFDPKTSASGQTFSPHP